MKIFNNLVYVLMVICTILLSIEAGMIFQESIRVFNSTNGGITIITDLVVFCVTIAVWIAVIKLNPLRKVNTDA